MNGQQSIVQIITLVISVFAYYAYFLPAGIEFNWLGIPCILLLSLPAIAEITAFKLGIDDLLLPVVAKGRIIHPYHKVTLLVTLLAILGWKLLGHDRFGTEEGGFPLFWPSGFSYFYLFVGAPSGALASFLHTTGFHKFVPRGNVQASVAMARASATFPWKSAIFIFVCLMIHPALMWARDNNLFS